jgi:hypothetical protein
MFKPHDMPSGNKTSTGLVVPAACFFQYPGSDRLNRSLTNFTGSDRWTNPASTTLNSTEPNLKNFVKFKSNDDLNQAFDNVSWALLLPTGALLLLLFFVETRCCQMCCTRNEQIRADRMRGTEERSNDNIFLSGGLVWIRLIYWFISLVLLIMGAVRFKLLQTWMFDSNWFGDKGEVDLETSYGQFMPLMLLIIPLMSAVGAVLST